MDQKTAVTPRRVALVGNPNVGKSVVFGALTGVYATVSNYPGTTVEVMRGKARFGGLDAEVIDTPGMYSLVPVTEEEAVARRLIMLESPDVTVHVVDAKNMERMLPLTFELLESKSPAILVLNMMDEADRLGIDIDSTVLTGRLGIPVILASASRGTGVAEIRSLIGKALTDDRRAELPDAPLTYSASIEEALASIIRARPKTTRAEALLLLQEDEEALASLEAQDKDEAARVSGLADALARALGSPVSYGIALARRTAAKQIAQVAIRETPKTKGRRLYERLDALTMTPITGIPLLLAILYLGLYKFVGTFGAGTLVDYLEGTVFEEILNPWVTEKVGALVPSAMLQSFLVGEYGMFTLGIRYAVGIILPIVATYFLVFAILEDSGYLPRLAMLMDRLFKRMGLSGRAVIPMTLGFGCGTVATVVSRTLETKRERIIATLLLALAIPCSAQLGIIMGLLEDNPTALGAWATFLGIVFLLVAHLTTYVIPGQAASFYMELPPLRLPSSKNVFSKTFARMYWYLAEVLPIFVVTSILLVLGDMTGILDKIVGVVEPIVGWVGLPKETARAFLFGFFRRDYGAAGLYDLQKAGALTDAQLVVAAATLTLFVPCVAQFLVMVKERGMSVALAIAAFIFPFAFAAGAVFHLAINALGVL